MSDELQVGIDNMRKAGIPENAIKSWAMDIGHSKNKERVKKLSTYTPAMETNYSGGVESYSTLLPASAPNFGETESDLIQSIFKANKQGGYDHEIRGHAVKEVGHKFETETKRK